jgi:hypothetical protein
MVGRKPLIGLLLAVGLTYGIYPYVTLYRLGQAIRSGDAVRLWNGKEVLLQSLNAGIIAEIVAFPSDLIEVPEVEVRRTPELVDA